jgi:hypothetical protein
VGHADDIIDGADMIAWPNAADDPLDQEARHLILGRATRLDRHRCQSARARTDV